MKKTLLFCCFINAALVASSNLYKGAWSGIGGLNNYYLGKDNLLSFSPSHSENAFAFNDDWEPAKAVIREGICKAFLNAGFQKGKKLAGFSDVFWSSSNPQKVGFVLVAVMALYGTAHFALTIKNKLAGEE